jgi:hypothetical protein
MKDFTLAAAMFAHVLMYMGISQLIKRRMTNRNLMILSFFVLFLSCFISFNLFNVLINLIIK